MAVVPIAAAGLIAGCGGGDDDGSSSTELTATKTFLTDHTADLVRHTTTMQEAADEYYDLAESSGFDYEELLAEKCDAVDASLTKAKGAFVEANPNYEQMEGIVAGIPRTAQYDTDLDAGTDGSDPTSAVSFNLTLPDGKVMEQPGNLFFLLETSLYGTNENLVVKGVKPDVNCDGKVEFGEGLPEANALKASADEMARQAKSLEADAQELEISDSDAFTAITVMTKPEFITGCFDAYTRVETEGSGYVYGTTVNDRRTAATHPIRSLKNKELPAPNCKVVYGLDPRKYKDYIFSLIVD
mgnify:CR=1 FL=1